MSLALSFSLIAAFILSLIWIVLVLFVGVSSLSGYLLAISFCCFALCAWDKTLAQRGQARIPEKILLTWSMLGGTPGMLLGMVLFRHKTQKSKFQFRLLLILAFQLLLPLLSGLFIVH